VCEEAIEGKAPMRSEITGPERKEVTLLVKFDRRPGDRPDRLRRESLLADAEAADHRPQ
jgi:hypothetical protein